MCKNNFYMCKNNSAFINKVEKLKNSLEGPVTENPEDRLRRWLGKRETPIPVFEFRAITLDELDKYIKKMKGGKSCGIDDIDSYSLKLAAPYIKPVLLHLINLSLAGNTFPSEWKTQLIYPNYKTRNSEGSPHSQKKTTGKSK